MTGYSIRTAARAAVIGVGMLATAVTVAEAQRTIGGFPRSDQSDVTGPAVTSGDQLAPLFAEPGTVRSMACPVAWGVRTASDRVQVMLASTSLAPPDAGVAGSINSAAQRNVLNLLTGAEAERDSDGPVLTALLVNNAGAASQARRLVAEADGLLRVMETLDPLRPGRAAPTQLARVTAAYNAFVDASSDEFMTAPPGEMLALHAVLNELVSASIQNEGRPADPSSVDAAGLACAGAAAPVVPVVVAAPPPADRPFEMCVLMNGDFRIAAGLLTAEGDSIALVDDRRVPFGSVYTAASDVPTASWVSRGEAVTIEGVRYQPFGVTRAVEPGETVRSGYHEGYAYFVGAGEADSPVIYFVSGADCLVQPYRSVETIQVRG